MRRTVAVTGAAGRIGRELVRYLRCWGYEVTPIVRGIDSRSPTGSVSIDLATEEATTLEEILNPRATVIHAAAAVPSGGSQEDCDARADLTRTIDRNVVLIAKKVGTPLVYLSGCSLYDNSLEAPKKEDARIRGTSPYLRAKVEGEKTTLDVERNLVVRLSNPVGVTMPESTAIGRWIRSARRGETIQVWGSGRREQDYLALEDVSRGIQTCIDAQTTGVLNLAQGKPTTMLELAHTIQSVFGRGQVTVGGHQDPAEYQTARFSVDRAKALGWQPRVSLSEMVQAMAAPLEM